MVVPAFAASMTFWIDCPGPITIRFTTGADDALAAPAKPILRPAARAIAQAVVLNLRIPLLFTTGLRASLVARLCENKRGVLRHAAEVAPSCAGQLRVNGWSRPGKSRIALGQPASAQSPSQSRC